MAAVLDNAAAFMALNVAALFWFVLHLWSTTLAGIFVNKMRFPWDPIRQGVTASTQ
jgi:hypothetical protein